LLDVSMGSDNSNNSQPSKSNQTNLHLRWTNLTKSVSLGDDPASIGRFSVAGRLSVTTTSKINDPNAPQQQQVPKPSTKVILDSVSGEARPGELLATMGPSGSGKTSLMNVLCGRAAYQDGSITINGTPLNKAAMKKLLSKVAYVKQQDIFFEALTVRDQLTYTARLRFPDTNTTTEARNERIQTEVDRILRMLRLTKVADNQIMMCSGGEKKRVNIGTELLTDPSIILLDEPTSGLDSASAASLLNVLRDLAKNHNKTIITSIHQPNSATFLNTFDKLLMLADGKAVYFGTPAESLQYLKKVGFPCPEGYNAADHWMDLLVTGAGASVDVISDSEEEVVDGSTTKSLTATKAPKSYLRSIWDNDAVASRLQTANEVQRATNSASDVVGNKRKSRFSLTADGDTTTDNGGSKYATSWMTQYKTLTHRAFAKSKHSVFSKLNIIKTVSTGVAVGIVYLNKRYTELDVFNIYAYFFFVMLYWVMDGMFTALFAFPVERVVILKERATASYRLSAYYMANTTADLPVFLCMPFIFLIVSYWMAVPTLGITTFILVLLISLLSVVTGQGLGQLVGAAFDDVQIGQAVATVAILFLMLMGGFFANNLPVWLSWVRYVSPFAFASNAALGVIFRDPIPCDGSGELGALCMEGADGDGFYADAAAVRDSFAVFGTVPSNIACLLAACVLPRLLAYWFLRRKKAGERE